ITLFEAKYMVLELAEMRAVMHFYLLVERLWIINSYSLYPQVPSTSLVIFMASMMPCAHSWSCSVMVRMERTPRDAVWCLLGIFVIGGQIVRRSSARRRHSLRRGMPLPFWVIMKSICCEMIQRRDRGGILPSAGTRIRRTLRPLPLPRRCSAAHSGSFFRLCLWSLSVRIFVLCIPPGLMIVLMQCVISPAPRWYLHLTVRSS